MLDIRKVSVPDIFKSGVDDKIIEFDKVNMAEILTEAGLPFPEEKLGHRDKIWQNTVNGIAKEQLSVMQRRIRNMELTGTSL